MGKVEANTATFGRASVELDPATGFVLQAASARKLVRYGIAELQYALVLASFCVVAVDPTDVPVTVAVKVSVDGDPGVLIAVVDAFDRTFAVHAIELAADGAAFVIETDEFGASIQVLELRTIEDAIRSVEQLNILGGPSAASEPTRDEAGGDLDRGQDWSIPPDGAFYEPATGGYGDIEPRPPWIARPPGPDRGLRPGPGARPRAATLSPSDEVLAHVLAEMPETSRIDQLVEVKVSLSWLPQAPARDVEHDEAIIPIDPGLPVFVSVSTQGYRLLSRGRRTRTLRLRLSQPKNVVRFKLRAIAPGPAEVSIVVRQRSELPLATLRLTSSIVDGEPTSGLAHAKADARIPDPAVTALPTLRIDESVAGSESSLDIVVQIGTAPAIGSTRTIDKSHVVTQVYEKISALRTRLRKEQGDDETKMSIGLVQLRAIGVELSRTLFSRPVREFLWKHLNELDGLVIQTTGEFDIPWEIVYISNPAHSVDEEPAVVTDQFLGMRGATRWVYNTAMPIHVTVRRGRAKYLCPSYLDPGLSLDFNREEGEFVRRRFHATLVRPGTATEVSKVVTSGFDLLHFGGHGVWTASPPDQRILLAPYRRKAAGPPEAIYSAMDLRRDLPDHAMADPTAPAPMVFLNACDIGRIDTSVAGLGGFPEAFLRGGIGVLLGCSWAVNDRIAGEFVQHFYDALSDSDIAGAVRQARTETLANADLSGLAYVVYSHPHATVDIT